MMNYKPFLCIIMLFGVIIFNQCGNQNTTSKQSLDIVFLNVKDNIPIEPIKKIINTFEESNDDLIINTTTAIVDVNESYSELLERFRNTDVIIFPSILEDTLSAKSSSFYPISATSTNLSDSIQQHYRQSNDKGIWAVPFLYDPIIKIIRKDAVTKTGDQFFPDSWNKTLLISELALSDDSYRYPLFQIIESDEYSYTDTLAAYYLSRGLFHEVIIGNGFSNDMSMELHRIGQYDIFKTISMFMTNDAENKDYNLKTIKSIEDFIETKGLFSFVRHSDLNKSSKSIQSNFYWGIAPTIHDEKPILCYSINAAIPIESDLTDIAKLIIKELTVNNHNINEMEGYLSNHEMKNNSKTSENNLMLIRSNNKTLHTKIFKDILNQKKDIIDFNGIWLQSYNIIN